jgi:cystathionine beta-lyase
VNTPPHRVSTVLYPTVADMRKALPDPAAMRYGRLGTPSSWAFEQPVAALEGAAGAISLPSGLAALTAVMDCFAGQGDQVLIPHSAYGPTWRYATEVLPRRGIRVEIYDTRQGVDGLRSQLTANTRLVLLESPGSAVLDVPDVPAMAEVIRAAGALSAIDNTWATPLFFRPLDHGCDLVIHSASKYLSGHSDGTLGIVAARETAVFERLRDHIWLSGVAAGSEELYQGTRGLRTLAVRLPQHQAAALQIAEWLQSRPEVETVFHPALDCHPDHATWKRLFTGASGVFSFTLKQGGPERLAALMDHRALWSIGYSWGGYESLILPFHEQHREDLIPLRDRLVRLSVGLESTEDLIADLADGFSALSRITFPV